MNAHQQPINKKFKSGYVGILGRPNVGKSTLLNSLVGQKVAITSQRAQTTRHRIVGILTTQTFQCIFFDTPGIHQSSEYFNRIINRAADSVLHEVDLYLLLVDARGWNKEDQNVLNKLKDQNVPIVLVINKMDLLVKKDALLPIIEQLKKHHDFDEIIPISAKNNKNTDRLKFILQQYLPEGDVIYDAEMITDRGMRFMASELIREQLFRQLGQELPYVSAVSIEQYQSEKGIDRIHATIWVEKRSQKAIVIGKKGERLKKIGSRAREQLQQMLEKKVYLDLWVKVREGWAENDHLLKSLGYIED